MAKFLFFALVATVMVVAQVQSTDPKLDELMSRLKSRYPKAGGQGFQAGPVATASATAQSSASYNGNLGGAQAAASAFAGLGSVAGDTKTPIEPIAELPQEARLPESELGVAPPAPERPTITLDHFKTGNIAFQNFPSRFKSRLPAFSKQITATASAGAYVNGAQVAKPASVSDYATSASEASVTGLTGATESAESMGAAGAAAAAQAQAQARAQAQAQAQAHVESIDDGEVTEDEENFSYSEPEETQELAAAAGTLADETVVENQEYHRDTEDLEEHEDGNAEDDHYYKAQSYGKAGDTKKKENYNKNFEDIEHTPTVYKRKTGSESYNLDFNKQLRETGSGVLAKDRRRSAFNRNAKRFNERVNQARTRVGAGLDERATSSTNNGFDEEDEEISDSDGFGPTQQAANVEARGAAGSAHAAAKASVSRRN